MLRIKTILFTASFSLLFAASADASSATVANDCKNIRGVINLSRQYKLPVDSLLRLEKKHCQVKIKKQLGVRAPCKDLGVMLELVKIDPAGKKMVKSVAIHQATACRQDTHYKASNRRIYWPNGMIAKSKRGVWYYPNGFLASYKKGSWNYPSGKMARLASGQWYYPNGRLAHQNGQWITPAGTSSKGETRFISQTCSAAVSKRCLRVLPTLPRHQGTARQAALVGLSWKAHAWKAQAKTTTNSVTARKKKVLRNPYARLFRYR
jgi:hypothetical protein